MLQHGIKLGESAKVSDIQLNFPPLYGNSIEEHFNIIATEQVHPYNNLLNELLSTYNSSIPPMPSEWIFKPGWTHYSKLTGEPTEVHFPNDEALIFDVEVCMLEGKGPTLACALGKSGWYSWCSKLLCESCVSERLELIPLESTNEHTDNYIPRIIVGHNVSYDRARIKEQYWLQQTRTRFLDTMSMHTCISGVTSYQRAMMKSKRELSDEDLVWSEQSSLNSLADIYQLYCNDQLKKDRRNIFVDGTLIDIRKDFQNLVEYCASDVKATLLVLKELYPMFLKRFPHPATFAGMLEIGMAYLPVSSNWNRYIQEANLAYEDLNIEAKFLLEKRANQACRLSNNDAFKQDLWMWDQDWSRQDLKLKKGLSKKSRETQTSSNICSNGEIQALEGTFKDIIVNKMRLPLRRPLLPGYPAWYRKLCDKNTSSKWVPGPCNIGTGMQVNNL